MSLRAKPKMPSLTIVGDLDPNIEPRVVIVAGRGRVVQLNKITEAPPPDGSHRVYYNPFGQKTGRIGYDISINETVDLILTTGNDPLNEYKEESHLLWCDLVRFFLLKRGVILLGDKATYTVIENDAGLASLYGVQKSKNYKDDDSDLPRRNSHGYWVLFSDVPPGETPSIQYLDNLIARDIKP